MVAGGHVWLPGGVRGDGGCAWLPGGVHGWWGACVVAGGHAWLPGGVWHWSCDTHAPPVDRMTDMCKNITFANFVCGR